MSNCPLLYQPFDYLENWSHSLLVSVFVLKPPRSSSASIPGTFIILLTFGEVPLLLGYKLLPRKTGAFIDPRVIQGQVAP